MIDIKLLTQFMSKPEHFAYVNASANDTEKRKRIDELKAKFLTGNFSAAANFAAAFDTSDVGNPEMTDYSIYDDCSTFAEYSAKAKEVTAFGRIKSLVANSNVAASVKTYALQRNESIRAANKIAEAKKAKKKDNISRPFWY
jgi:hypothetical protein